MPSKSLPAVTVFPFFSAKIRWQNCELLSQEIFFGLLSIKRVLSNKTEAAERRDQVSLQVEIPPSNLIPVPILT